MNFRHALSDAWLYVPGADLILRHALWDLVLGVVAVLLGWGFAHSLRWTSGWRGGLRWLLGALWLLFLPNAAYLIATIRSIPDVNLPIFLAYASSQIDGSRRTTASLLWVFFYVGIALVGVALYGASVYPVQRRLPAGRRAALVACVLVSLAASVGVDVGLSRRFNSWDILSRPDDILRAVVDRVLHPGVETGFVVLFGLLLALVWYLAGLVGAGYRARHVVANSSLRQK